MKLRGGELSGTEQAELLVIDISMNFFEDLKLEARSLLRRRAGSAASPKER